MSRYGEQGSKVRDLGGVKAPPYGTESSVIKEAQKPTTGIVGMAGIGKNGVPIKGNGGKS
jgi:hypothetical protein